MTGLNFRIEKDSMGELQVPADALYAAQTQRAVDNFPVSGIPLPPAFIQAVALIKQSAAKVNVGLGLLEPTLGDAIVAAAEEIIDGQHLEHFPVDVFQTGSGTSTNMNANEVIATLASRRLGQPVSANDHVNMSQSSNDTIPTAIHVSAALAVNEDLLPALAHLHSTLVQKGIDLKDVVKTGRTHLMDAMPIRLGQELDGWAMQVDNGRDRIRLALARIYPLAQGGTAVGTGINAHPEFAACFAKTITEVTDLPFEPSPSFYESLSCQDAAVELSGQLKTLACSLMKIANDLRWMNSGPLAGLGEIELPALQPGSSIMPGKVNPVIPEVVNQIAFEVIGNDVTVSFAAEAGQLQLNAFEPIIAHSLFKSVNHLKAGCLTLATRCVAGITANREHLRRGVENSIGIVTALNPYIGYANATEIAQQALMSGESVYDLVLKKKLLTREQLDEILKPEVLTQPRAFGVGKPQTDTEALSRRRGQVD